MGGGTTCDGKRGPSGRGPGWTRRGRLMLRPLTTFKALRLAFGKLPQPRVGQVRPPVVALLAARLAECEQLEAPAPGRRRGAATRPTPACSPGVWAEIHADVVAYTESPMGALGLGRADGRGRGGAGRGASAPGRVSLGAAVAAFADGMRGGAEKRSAWGTSRALPCWPRSHASRRPGSGVWRPLRAGRSGVARQPYMEAIR